METLLAWLVKKDLTVSASARTFDNFQSRASRSGLANAAPLALGSVAPPIDTVGADPYAKDASAGQGGEEGGDAAPEEQH